MTTPFPPDFFERYDESADEDFYTMPRLVNHIDDGAIRATTALYAQVLPAQGTILDLMSSWVSHLPTDRTYAGVVGLGMNEDELQANPQLTSYVVQNLNVSPALPFDDEAFDGAVCTVSVQYLTQPVRVFAEVGRALRPGAPFAVSFSNRMFPTKAVAIWQSLNDRGHVDLVGAYMQRAGMFGKIEAYHASQRGGDPLYTVVGYRND